MDALLNFIPHVPPSWGLGGTLLLFACLVASIVLRIYPRRNNKSTTTAPASDTQGIASPPAPPAEVADPIHTAPKASALDVVDFLAEAIFRLDASEHIVSANRTASVMFGYAAEAFERQPLDRFLTLPGSCEDLAGKHILSGQQALGLEHRAIGLRKDGSQFPTRVTLSLISRNPMAVAIAVREGTPNTSEALAKVPPLSPVAAPPAPTSPGTHEELEATSRLITGFANLLSQGQNLPPAEQEYVDEILRGGRQLERFLHTAELLRRIESKDLGIRPQPLDWNQFVAEFVESRQVRETDGQIDLFFTRRFPHPLVALFDPAHVQWILNTVLAYARDHLESPRISVFLEHSEPADAASTPKKTKGDPSRPRGQLRQVSIQMIVAGARQLDLRTVSNSTARQAPKPETDFHINIALRLAQALGGQLGYRHREDGSSVFEFSMDCRCFGCPGQERTPALEGKPAPQSVAFPNGRALPSQEPEKRPSQESGSPAPSPLPQPVLVVSIDPKLTNWCRELLSAEHLECMFADSPADAIHRLRKGEEFHALILQADHPDALDFDLVYEVRLHRDENCLPIVLLHTDGKADSRADVTSGPRAINYPYEGRALLNALAPAAPHN